MKRYWVFSGNIHHAPHGIDGCVATTNDLYEALRVAGEYASKAMQWAQVFDAQEMRVVDPVDVYEVRIQVL